MDDQESYFDYAATRTIDEEELVEYDEDGYPIEPTEAGVDHAH